MSERLTLQDLVDLLSDKQGITKKDAETFLRELVALISETIDTKDFVRIKDFGTFKLTLVSARRSVDVNTGASIEIPAHYKLSFTPEKVLREGVNRPFSHFESILLEDDVTFENKPIAEPEKAAKVASKEVTPVKEDKVEAISAVPVVEKVEAIVEQPKAVAPIETKVVKEESPLEDNKVDEALSTTPEAPAVEKLKEFEEALLEESELADINSFLTKGISEKKEVEPLVTSSDSSVKKEEPVVAPKQVKKVEQPITNSKPSAVEVANRQDEYDDFIDYDYLAEQKKKRNLWVGLGLFFLLLIGIGFWGYNKYFVKPDSVPYALNNDDIIIHDFDELATDSAKKADEVEKALTQEMKDATETKIEEELEKVIPTLAESKEVEVRTGQTMRALGQEYYGHGAFWVYIFEENRDRIERPDAVYAGMKIKIAPADKYDIDPDNKESVKKATQLERKLFGEFSK